MELHATHEQFFSLRTASPPKSSEVKSWSDRAAAARDARAQRALKKRRADGGAAAMSATAVDAPVERAPGAGVAGGAAPSCQRGPDAALSLLCGGA
eukprot:7867313-Pyramimonas_sp.AAC.1